ncbi:unnamed protein product [Rotaria sp. Silwood1]|nr:unnamed protein product [Rotaria sp. Silwood1]
MANNNNNNGEQAENKNSKKMVFITSIDDDNHNILSCLNSKNVEAIVVNLNNTNLMNGYQINNEIPKQSLSQSEKQISSIDVSKNTNTKKRKADLTCVICEGQAIGYNFDQISCESCKAFFRRNAFHPIEKTKCINYNDNVFEVRCNIRYDIKYKCQRCRLLKCFREVESSYQLAIHIGVITQHPYRQIFIKVDGLLPSFLSSSHNQFQS